MLHTIRRWSLAFIAVLIATGLILMSLGPAATTATAAETKPSISVSGKYCPKSGSGSAFNRKGYIPDKAKAKSKICTIETNDGSHLVDLDATYTLKKRNDSRIDVAIKITPFAYAHAKDDDGLNEWWITAWADSAYLSGQGRYTMDELGKAWYDNVPGKRFSISVRWWVYTEHRYWDNNQAKFVRDTGKRLVTMKTVKFVSFKKK